MTSLCGCKTYIALRIATFEQCITNAAKPKNARFLYSFVLPRPCQCKVQKIEKGGNEKKEKEKEGEKKEKEKEKEEDEEEDREEDDEEAKK